MYKSGSPGPPIHIRHYPDIPCESPEKHKDHQRPSGGCSICILAWRASLPWYHPKNDERDRMDESLLLKLQPARGFPSLSRIDKSRQRHSYTFKDYWADSGEEWRGFTCEIFCVEIAERDDPENYPWPRFVDDEEPGLILHICRWRICYEPQKVWKPLFLEIQFLSDWSKDVLIQGLDADLEIEMADLEPLLRLRAFLFSSNDSGDAPPTETRGANVDRVSLANEDFKERCRKAAKSYARAPRQKRQRMVFTLAGVYRHIAKHQTSESQFYKKVAECKGLEEELFNLYHQALREDDLSDTG